MAQRFCEYFIAKMSYDYLSFISEKQKDVFYITNTVLTWTCDLISNFRQMNYFLAFHYEKVGKPGKGVGWEQIDMSKAD